MKLEFARQIFEKYINMNFLKIRSLETEFHVDGRADMTKPVVFSPNFAKAPKYEISNKHILDFQ